MTSANRLQASCGSLLAWLLVVFATGRSEVAAEARVPPWATHGAYVYRISTPDEPNVLPQIEAGVGIVSNLLDKSVPQILILNGIIGHDHPGACNWDGTWPDWDRVTFRADHDWKKLSDFMMRARDRSNTYCGFHLNVTDVNVGLRDYPETRDFFQKLVEAKAIYRRGFNKQTGRYDIDPPSVPTTIPTTGDPIEIFALVNYQRFWDSGLARQMIDTFYGHLPYAPPLLYLDVLNTTGGNFSTGLPDGPLGGSEQTQRDGVISILDYLHSKGTDVATEGPRPEFGKRAGYVWLHGRGFSADDYSVIAGGSFELPARHVLGNPGAFNLSPAALSPAALDKVRAHYQALLAGKPGVVAVADSKNWHLTDRSDIHDEFDIPGTGDPYRGTWSDLVNDFYLQTLPELYHLGLGATRTAVVKSGWIHLGKFALSAPDRAEISVSIPDFVGSWQGETARQNGQIMLEMPITTKLIAPAAGMYRLKIQYKAHSRDKASLNLYVNEALYRSFESIDNSDDRHDTFATLDAGDVQLRQGGNTISFDYGPIRATWSDGAVAAWTTPYLRRGFKVASSDVVLADDFDRMYPDTWSGQRKIYFFSWDGTQRSWKLPADWRSNQSVNLYALTPTGRSEAARVAVINGSVSPTLLPQVPYVLTPG